MASLKSYTGIDAEDREVTGDKPGKRPKLGLSSAPEILKEG